MDLAACLLVPVSWSRALEPSRPLTASVNGQRWVLELGDFPEEPLYTLVIDGVAVGSFSEWPVAWGRPGERRVLEPALPRPAPVELDFCAAHYASGETWEPSRFEGPRPAEAPVDARRVEALLDRLVQAAEEIAHYTGETSPYQQQSEYRTLAHDLWSLGPGALPALVVGLSSRNFAVRCEAALAIGRLEERRGAAALTRALADPHPAVRTIAAAQLGRLGDPRCAALLERAADDPEPHVRRAALSSLARLEPERALGIAERLGADEDFETRRAAAHVLSGLPGPKPLALLLAMAEDPTQEVRTIAHQRLRAPDARHARAALVGLLASPSERVVLHTANELLESDPLELRGAAIEALLRLAAEGSDAARVGVAGTLGGVVEPRAIESLARLLSDPARAVRWHAAHSFVRLGAAVDPLATSRVLATAAERDDARAISRPLVEAFEKLTAQAPDRVDRDAVGRALAHLVATLGDDYEAGIAVRAALPLGDQRVETAIVARILRGAGFGPSEERTANQSIGQAGFALLVRALSSDDEAVRQRAAAALAWRGLPGTNEVMLPLLWDGAPEIRAHAASAMVEEPRALQRLVELQSDLEPRVRAAAARALGRSADPRALGPLTRALADESYSVVHQAAAGLAALGDTRAVDPLIGLLADPDMRHRREAAKALGHLADPRAIEPLTVALDDSERAVGDAARHALTRLSAAAPPQPARPTPATDAELLAAIWSAPEDDTPRLAYAARLAERGDARGEYIRVQCDMHRLGGPPVRSGWSQAHERAKVLEREHGGSWFAPMKRSTYSPGSFETEGGSLQVRRGFPDHLVATVDYFWREGEALLRHYPITGLSLYLSAAGAIGRIAALPSLARIRHLSLADTRLGDEDVRALASSPHLSAVRRLDLGQNGITARGVAALASSPALGRLRQLSLQRNALGAEGVRALAARPTFRELVELSLHGCELDDDGARTLAESAHFSRLQQLFLGKNAIADAGATALAESRSLPALVELSLGSNRIGDAGAAAFGLSTERSALEVLGLQDNVIGEAGARALAESTTLTSLRSLDISSNPLGEAGVNAFAVGAGLPALRQLSIGDNGITTDEERDFVDFDGTVVGRGGARETITALRARFAGKPHLEVS